MTEPRPLTLVQFAHERGLVTTADVDGHIHAGLRSMPTTKTYARWNAAALAKLQADRDATTAAYRAAIEAGEIREFTRAERLELQANGHPDNESTRAAQRLLAKRKMTEDVDRFGLSAQSNDTSPPHAFPPESRI